MECPICFDELKDRFIIKCPCRHIFCLDCLLSLKDFTCPICRTNFKNQMSANVQDIIKKNNRFEEKKITSSEPNIHSYIEFPPLQG